MAIFLISCGTATILKQWWLEAFLKQSWGFLENHSQWLRTMKTCITNLSLQCMYNTVAWDNLGSNTICDKNSRDNENWKPGCLRIHLRKIPKISSRIARWVCWSSMSILVATWNQLEPTWSFQTKQIALIWKVSGGIWTAAKYLH